MNCKFMKKDYGIHMVYKRVGLERGVPSQINGEH